MFQSSTIESNSNATKSCTETAGRKHYHTLTLACQTAAGRGQGIRLQPTATIDHRCTARTHAGMLPARITLRLYPCPPLRARAAVSRLALALGTRRPARREFRRHAQRLDIVVSARNAISGAAVRSAAPEKDHVCGCCGAQKKIRPFKPVAWRACKS